MAETTEQYRNRINQLKTGIENEPYIKKMRENIAEGISKTGNRQADIEVRQDKLEDDFVAVQQDARSNTPSGAELAVAAGEYNTLGERLDAEQNKVNAQLAQNSLSDEQLRAYVDLLQQQVTSMGDISPEPYSTYADLVNADPNHSGVYVVNEDGNWYYWNSYGNLWDIGGRFQSSGIGDKTVTNSKLADKYSDGGTLDGSANFNTLMRAGNYIYTGTPSNCPPELTSGIINNHVVAGRWLYQHAQKLGAISIYGSYIRVYDTVSGTGNWQLISNPNNYKFPYLTSANDLNNIIEEGKWVAISPKNSPFTATWNVKVERYYTLPNSDSYWGVQTATTNSPNQTFVEYTRNFMKTTAGTTWGVWVRVSSPQTGMTGKIIVEFGDSIKGNTQGANSVSAFTAEKTGATVINIGFGGSRIAKHNQYWDAFSLYRLVDEIKKPSSDSTKWLLQDEAINAMETGLVGGMPSYFKTTLELLKTIDFTKVDYITIAGGTNDFAAGVLLDNELDKKDTNTLGGSLRYSLETLYSEYKQLKILVQTPIYRFWTTADGTFIDDSTTREFNGKKLIDFVDKEIEVAIEFNTPYSDNYRELGINKFNKELYFPSNDGTHPNAVGNKKLGYKNGSDLLSSF